MEFETFLLERNQSLYENQVEINLTESGVHPFSLRELLEPDELEALLDLPLGYGHTEGTPALRDEIASWHPGALADNVLVTTGASEANLLALLASVSAGDEVVVILPNFMQIPGAARALGANVREVTLSEELGWRIDREALFRTVSARTKMIALCNPNNPTGITLSDADRCAVLEACERSGAWLLADEIYRGAELEGRKATATFWGANDRVIITGGLAKSFAHAGLRIGWIIAPPPFVYECMRRQDYTTIGSNAVGQFVGTLLLRADRREKVFSRNRKILNRNLGLLKDWAAMRANSVSLVPPEAGGMAFLNYARLLNSTELSHRLRIEENVFVVAGDWFGLDGRIRVGIGGDQGLLLEGLSRLGRFLDRL
jgi:aspartate/methionine/tyrosine aminotransferase